MPKRKRTAGIIGLSIAAALLAGALLFPAVGCGGGGAEEGSDLILAASITLEETGILGAWVEDFESMSGYRVETVPVPSTQALQMARHGECDALITDLPYQEERLERDNYIEGRREVMHDCFVIVGPPDDPAGVGEAEKAPEAFFKIAEAQETFICRIDGSGTSCETADIWSTAGVEDFGGWFVETEAGMEETLRQASLEEAYTLSDLSSLQALSGELSLETLFNGAGELPNPYHVMAVSLLAYPDTNLQAAMDLADYLLSDNARRFFSLGAWEPPSEVTEDEGDEAGGGGG